MALSRKGKIIIGITAVVLLAIIIAATVFATRKDVAEVTVVEVKVRPTLKSTVTAPGEIRPVQYINLTSEVQGRIVEIFVKEGDPVRTRSAGRQTRPDTAPVQHRRSACRLSSRIE